MSKFELPKSDDSMQRPPAFTKCVDCNCCYAELYAGKDPICWACDAGEPCKGKLVGATRSHAKPSPPQPQPSPQPAPVQEKPMGIKSTHGRTTRISDEIRAAIITADPSVKHADLARKYGISDVSVFTIRKAAGIVLVKGPHAKRGPNPGLARAAKAFAVAVSAPKQAAPKAPRVLESDTFVVTLNLTLGELDAIFSKLPPDVKVVAISAALQAKAGVA